MASVVTCIATSAGFCFCSAVASLFNSCCGTDKSSSDAPSATSGRKRSVLLLVFSIAIAFAFQYGVAPYVTSFPYSNYVVDAWTDGCLEYQTQELRDRCAGNNGVYRSAASATLFFVLAGIAVACKRTANREAWPAKYVLFFFLVLATCFIPNTPLFSPIYINIARAGSVIYIFIQQIIFIDVAYNWNESWVGKADAAEAEETGSGKKWLSAILVSCAILFLATIVGIVLLFVYFDGCRTNTAFISVTLILCILATAAQLSGEEGSLLASALVSAYATYLCYTAVSKNPNGSCNPQLGEENILGIVLGVGLTTISLAWTGWSYTAEAKINGSADLSESLVDDPNKHSDDIPNQPKKVTGVVTNQNYGSNTTDEESPAETAAATESTSTTDNANKSVSVTWKLNLVLAVISCFYAMSLTGWGSINSGGNAANPSAGSVGMWMIIASQWLVMALYLWTLVAPRLFPDREFS